MDKNKCQEWLINRDKVPIVNPFTNRTLTLGGPTYQKLDRDCATIWASDLKTKTVIPAEMVIIPVPKIPTIARTETITPFQYSSAEHEVRIGLTDSGNGIWVCGPATFTYKTDMISLGGKWNASRKCWVFSILGICSRLLIFAKREKGCDPALAIRKFCTIHNNQYNPRRPL